MSMWGMRVCDEVDAERKCAFDASRMMIVSSNNVKMNAAVMMLGEDFWTERRRGAIVICLLLGQKAGYRYTGR